MPSEAQARITINTLWEEAGGHFLPADRDRPAVRPGTGPTASESERATRSVNQKIRLLPQHAPLQVLIPNSRSS